MNSVLSTLSNIRRVDSRYWCYGVSVLSWAVAGFVPLVSFDAGGGQTAVEIIRYVVFRGLDRDVWYASGWLFMVSGMTAAAAVLVGMVLYSVGLAFNDRTLAVSGCGTVLVSLLVVIWATRPVAAVAVFGVVALPHLGWLTMMACGVVAVWSLWEGICMGADRREADSRRSSRSSALLSRAKDLLRR